VRVNGTSWKAGVTARDLLAQRFYVGGEWRELGSCSREDVLEIAADYQDRADRCAEHAAEFRQLAASMEAAGAETVADLFAEESAA
jgi:hypothetical protein